MRILTLALTLALTGPESDAALEVRADCFTHAATHTLVRDDVLARMDAADQNLPKAEAALKQAERDIQALRKAAETLQAQKAILEQHITLLESAMKAQQAVCHAGERPVSDAIGQLAHDAWETIDMPLGFAAGAGMCIGVAWGLQQVQR